MLGIALFQEELFFTPLGDNILQVDEGALQLTGNIAAFSDILIHLANTELVVFDGQGKGSPKNRIKHAETFIKGEITSTVTPEGIVSLDD
ncbi:hypothetical protein KSB_17780 [Ktedonobacter robiniae]|uniref:Uncharacterized protein n=1 Tax=Ktedonobacter robiniae TaxID=2778365 RepID=A0ABQ3UKU5_9CHLR|nr:hypothetical protein KSB_17780 [Ktedonobacter robiniae]